MNNVKKRAYKTKCETVIKALEKSNMKAYYCADAREAREKVLSMINQDDVVSWGGSITLDEIEVKEKITELGIKFIDRDTAASPEENIERRRQGLLADVFITGSNAVTLGGELVNIDGAGNRVAAMAYGPKKVIFVVGANKICTDIDSALKRIRLDACVENAEKMGVDTPCRVTGKCANCRIPDTTICGVIEILRFNRNDPDRIHVIMVGEDLGF